MFYTETIFESSQRALGKSQTLVLISVNKYCNSKLLFLRVQKILHLLQSGYGQKIRLAWKLNIKEKIKIEPQVQGTVYKWETINDYLKWIGCCRLSIFLKLYRWRKWSCKRGLNSKLSSLHYTAATMPSWLGRKLFHQILSTALFPNKPKSMGHLGDSIIKRLLRAWS